MFDIPLYQYLSEKLGSEDAVLTRRLLYSIMDYVCSTKHVFRMTSGSKGEGLDMEGSDFDIMVVLNNINIYDFTPGDTPPDSFIMSTKTTKPGFTHLQACDKINPILGCLCANFENQLCLSSNSLKLFIARLHNSTPPPSPLAIHGPCLSPDTEEEDLCICFRCRSWISLANQWITRNRLWPPSELVSEITDFGVLFVPIGCKGSPNEFLEWRISFSAAEKLLIHSFPHTQLLCYALLKLLLKEVVIEQNENLKGLLCSYFLKTVVFWVSESLPASEWRPDNIVSCFKQVFKRLLYYVEYNHLPHYFITDTDLFENRFSLQQQAELKDVLSRLYQMDIYCMEQSKTLSRFFHTIEQSSHDSMTTDEKNLTERFNILIRSQSDGFMTMLLTPKTTPEKLFNLQSHNKLKSNSFLYLITMYNVHQAVGSKHIVGLSTGNKDHYKDGHNKYFPYLLCGRKTDAVTGWLTIASYFYNMKRYQIVIDIIDHVLKKCTPDKLSHRTNSYILYQLNDINDNALHYSHSNVIDVFLRNVVRYQSSSFLSSILIPELKQVGFYSTLPPKVYACFIQFLCFHRLSDFQKRRKALIDLQTAVESQYSGTWSMATSLICLGVSHSTIGDRGKANSCYTKAFESEHHRLQYFQLMIDHLPQ